MVTPIRVDLYDPKAIEAGRAAEGKWDRIKRIEFDDGSPPWERPAEKPKAETHAAAAPHSVETIARPKP